MPAFLFLMKFGRVTVPLPWFPVWLLLLPFVPLAIVISPFFRKKNYGNILRNAHLAWWITVMLHGLEVNISSKSGDRVYLSFV